jgi:branched-chain amino acid transport system permease protein
MNPSRTAYCAELFVHRVHHFFFVRRVLFAPFGYAMRAARDSVLRSDAIGIDVKRMQWLAFALAGVFCGAAGVLFAFSKGSISPEAISVSRSVDGLVMVMLGGLQTLLGPVVGASVFTWLQDVIARETDYWRAILGLVILALVLLFPAGIAGYFQRFVGGPARQGRKGSGGAPELKAGIGKEAA